MKEIVSLTSLRGVAALLVVFFQLRGSVEGAFNPDDFTLFISRGYLWVDFFFILSGFIMCYIYGSKFSQGRGHRQTLEFYITRFARIYPLHFAVLLAFVGIEFGQLLTVQLLDVGGVSVFSEGTSPASLITNLLLIHSLGVHDTLTWNSPSWSISTEAAVYVVFPFLIATRLVQSRGGNAVLLLGAVGLLVGLQVARGNLDITYDYGILRCIADFSIGILIYRLSGALAGPSTGTASAMQAVAAVGIAVLLHHGAWDVLAIPLFALLIYACKDDRGWLPTIMAARPFHALGLISYSVYLTHTFVLSVFKQNWGAVLPKLAVFDMPAVALALAGVQLVIILGLSAFTYRWIEEPGRHYLRRRLSGWIRARSAGPTATAGA